VVDELARGVEQVSLGRDLRVVAVGDLVAGVLQDGEVEPGGSGVLLDFGGRLGRVRVDADDVNDARGSLRPASACARCRRSRPGTWSRRRG
jgi:hypothetical protein